MPVNRAGAPKVPPATTPSGAQTQQSQKASTGTNTLTGYSSGSAFEGDTRETQVRSFMDQMKLLRDHGTITEEEDHPSWLDSGQRLSEWGFEQVEDKLEALMKDPPRSEAEFQEKLMLIQNWAETNAWMTKSQFDTLFKELMGRYESMSRKMYQQDG